MSPPNPHWRLEDIFNLNKVELDKIKTQVASKVNCKYKTVGERPFGFPYANPVGGTPGFDPEAAEKAIKAYVELLNGKPTQQDGEEEVVSSAGLRNGPLICHGRPHGPP